MTRLWTLSLLSAALVAGAGCWPGGKDKKSESNDLYEVSYDRPFNPQPTAQASAKDTRKTSSGKRIPNDPAGGGGVGKSKGPNTPEDERENEIARLREADTMYGEATDAIKVRDYPLAESLLRQAVSLNREHPGYWSDLGRVQYWQGKHRYPEAQKSYRQTLDLLKDAKPANRDEQRRINNAEATVYANMGDLYREWDRPADALDAYRESNQRNPSLERLPGEMGHLYLKLGQYDDAEQQFRIVLSRNNNPTDQLVLKAHLGLAILYHLTDRNDQAYKEITMIEKQQQRVAPDLRQAVVDALKRDRTVDTTRRGAWMR